MEMTPLEIEAAFHSCFRRVQLIGGAPEPLYVPATEDRCSAQIYYREDFAASALHEIAHWCIAGYRRRQLVDFGYDYVPPPRTMVQQLGFFKLELKTQALESIFSSAAKLPFQVSADNLETSPTDFACQVEGFSIAVHSWLEQPAGNRARRFLAAIKDNKWTA
ncbi:MAG: elongation factor P hydroxylase [Limisphaerales bacterium]|jgi:elongation factor P hydroxylase